MLWREKVRTGNRAARAKVLLVVGGGASESDAIVADLQARGEFQILRAANAEGAELILRDSQVALALACADAAVPDIERLVAAVQRTGRSIPVLAIRPPRSALSERYAQLGVAVLRSPLLPDALARSLEVVLGLKNGG